MTSCKAITNKADMADMLERFFDLATSDGYATGWEWDDFEHVPFREPALEAWRQRILREVGHLVAPSRDAYSDKIANERIARIIFSLRHNEDA